MKVGMVTIVMIMISLVKWNKWAIKGFSDSQNTDEQKWEDVVLDDVNRAVEVNFLESLPEGPFEISRSNCFSIKLSVGTSEISQSSYFFLNIFLN